MTLDPATLALILGDHLIAWPDAPLEPARGVRFHSADVRPGDAFVALPGAATHGLRYADDALARGAAFVIADRPHPRGVVVDDAGEALLALGRAARAARSGYVIGITGSAGKTTTKNLLAAALDAAASPGNRNTPFALATVLVDAWASGDTGRPLVLELGVDRRGDMATLTALVRPTHGLLTAIAPAHLAGLGDLAGVAEEKADLLRAATTGRYAAEAAFQKLPDDARAGVHRYRVDDAPASSDGDTATARDVAVGRHRVVGERDLLLARLGDHDVRVALPGPGRALAENAMGALLLATELGVDARTAAQRIAGARLEGGRLTHHRWGDLLLIDDSYNANPDALRAALEVLARGPRPHTVVLGSMLELGPASADHHRAAGAALRAAGADLVWTVGHDARRVADEADVARHFDDADAAVAAAAELPAAGTVLVKGSRGIGLEALVRALRAAREEPA